MLKRSPYRHHKKETRNYAAVEEQLKHFDAQMQIVSTGDDAKTYQHYQDDPRKQSAIESLRQYSLSNPEFLKNFVESYAEIMHIISQPAPDTNLDTKSECGASSSSSSDRSSHRDSHPGTIRLHEEVKYTRSCPKCW